jgi:hypothetical protein
MEEIGRKRIAIVGVIVAGLVYFLVCAVPLKKELLLVPEWSKSLSSATSPVEAVQGAGAKPSAAPPASAATRIGANSSLATSQSTNSSLATSQSTNSSLATNQSSTSSPLPFRLGDLFGYFTDDGKILFAERVSYGVALAPDAYATYDSQSEGFTIHSPSGKELSRVTSPGYPFFAAGRRFVIGPDQATVSELGEGAAAVWSYQFPSIVTAFDASPSLAVFGLMDGTILGFDRSGKVALDFAPGGSRIAGVYGVAVSPDGLLAAAITGADKQRLVVLEKRSTAYRVAYHRYLSSDYRRPVAIAFTDDGRRLAYESPAGIGIYDRAGRDEAVVAIPARPRLGQTARRGELMVFLSSRGERKRLVCTASPDRRVADLLLNARSSFVITKGDAIFLGLDDRIVRMDLEER